MPTVTVREVMAQLTYRRKNDEIAVLTLKYNENEVISDTFAMHAELEKNTSLESVNEIGRASCRERV